MPKVNGGAAEANDGTRASSILLGGGKLRPFMMATKSAREDEKCVALLLQSRRPTSNTGGRFSPGKLREASQRGLVAFSLPMEEEKLP